MPGLENRAIRYYFYLKSGLGIVNEFRNLILAVLGLYIALKLDHWWLLPLMFFPSVILLTIAGFITVHRINKVTEWLNIRFSTHFGIKSFEYQKGIYEELKKLNEKV